MFRIGNKVIHMVQITNSECFLFDSEKGTPKYRQNLDYKLEIFDWNTYDNIMSDPDRIKDRPDFCYLNNNTNLLTSDLDIEYLHKIIQDAIYERLLND